MKKRGFTLIEIIVSIAIIALIGVGSFVGVSYINNQIVISRLNQITDKALNAAQVYIETNDIAYNEVYNNKSAAIIPLKTLVNEGLLNVDNTKLDDQDMEKNYVIQYLGGGGAGGSNCTDLSTIITSWNSTTPIYICNDGASGGINIKTIDKSEYNNRMHGSSEPYYFRGSLVSNYAKIDGNNTLYRIVGINTDDGIELYYGGYNHNFNLNSNQFYAGSIKTTSYTQTRNGTKVAANAVKISLVGCTNGVLIVGTSSLQYGDYYAEVSDQSNILKKTSICESNNSSSAASVSISSGSGAIFSDISLFSFDSWVVEGNFKIGSYSIYNSTGQYFGTINVGNYTLITLKPCMQIKSGSGTEYDPYIIKSNNC